MKDIKSRISAQGMTQVEMILELQKRGIVVQPPEMSAILRGVNTCPKATRVLEMSDKILSGLEKKAQ